MASGARILGHDFRVKVGFGSELNELASVFESKSET